MKRRRIRFPQTRGLARMDLVQLAVLYGRLCAFEHVGMTVDERDVWDKKRSDVMVHIIGRVRGK